VAEDPKKFLRSLDRGPYYKVLRLLEANPDLGIGGNVTRRDHHYVHENSTVVSLEMWGNLEGEEDSPEAKSAQELVSAMEAALQDKVYDWNRDITQQLYAALEEVQSDDYLIDWMTNGVDWRFDDDGNQVEMSDYVPLDNLMPAVRARVLRDYADLFDRTPEQVYTALMQRGYRFDKYGNRVDVSLFKSIRELDERTRKSILDKHRDFFVDNDDAWATGVQDNWQEKLEELGFSRVQISYSLGYSQGDGASFTADSIDVPKLCKAMMKMERDEALVNELVNGLIE